MKTIVMFIGPAGCGKSTAVYAYSKWLYEELGVESYKINFDPAAVFIPYEPDYDVRKIVSIDRIAKEFGLGPNGALVKAMEILCDKIDSVVNDIKNIENHFILIDTPGQMEILIFKDIAYKLINQLKKYFERIVAIFIVDADILKRYEDYAFLAILSVAVQTRLGVDVAPVVNKIDVVDAVNLSGDVANDVITITENLKNRGVYGEMMSSILKTVTMYIKSTRIPRISAKNIQGIEELHRIIHEVTCACGDLT